MPTSEYLNTLTLNNNGPFKIKNPLLVTFTQSNNTTTCDKTVAEIITALQAGRQAIAYVQMPYLGNVMVQAVTHWQDNSQRMVKFLFNLGIFYLIVSGINSYENGAWTGDSWTMEEKDLGLGDIDGVTITSPTSGQVLTYNGSGWVNGAPRDMTHLRDITASGSTQTVTFDANTAGTAFINIPSNLSISALSLTINVNNRSENYIWIENKKSSDVDVLISSVSHNNNTVTNAYLPKDGITVPAGQTCEIGLVVNQDYNGAYRVIVTAVDYLVGNTQ